MTVSFRGIALFLQTPLMCALAGTSLLSGCQLFSGHESCPQTGDVVFYQPAPAATSVSDISTYEEPTPPKIAPETRSAPPSPSSNEPSPVPKLVVPKVAPSSEAPMESVPKKQSSSTENKTEPETKPQPVKKPEPATSKPDKPNSSKKKPAKPKAKKPAKPTTDKGNSADENEQDDAADSSVEQLDPFGPADDQSLRLFEPRESNGRAARELNGRLMTPTMFELPLLPDSDDSAPRPRELPSAVASSRPIKDRQPMFEAALPSESKTPANTGATNAASSEPAVSYTVRESILTLDAYCDHLVFDRQGYGYVNRGKTIMRFSADGEVVAWSTLANPRGHQVEPDGKHLVCGVDRRAIVRLSYDGKYIGTAAKECDGAALKSPYDLSLDVRGGFYFTDPGFLQMDKPAGKIHYVDRFGNVSLVASRLGYPTGICFDAKRNRLLVVESLTGRLLELQLSDSTRVEAVKSLAELPKCHSVQCHVAVLCQAVDGSLFVTQPSARTVHQFSADGRLVGQFASGEFAPNAVAIRPTKAPELFVSGEFESAPRRSQVIRIALGE